jgi:outer membrane protein TolC
LHRLARSLVSVAAVVSVAALGQPAPTLLEAVAGSPTLAAARKRIDAARARIDAAGRFADPEVEAARSRVSALENRDMWELNVRQPLPRRGERAADRDRAGAAVGMAEAEYALAAGDLAADVAVALAEAEAADARGRLVETQLTRVNALLQSIEARLASGASARIADRLTVQSRVATLQLALETARRDAADAAAGARGRLGLPPSAPLPEYAAPALSEVSTLDAAALELANARVAEADANGRVARASSNPATSVGLRLERERFNLGNEDTIGLAFSSEIPWRTKRYARAEVRAAEADRAAAQADAVAARYRISSTLARAERAERLAATARRLSNETQSRLAVEHDALSRAVSVGTGGMGGESAVLHAVDILDKAIETQLQVIDAETTARAARAELWRFVSARRLLAPPANRENSSL